MTNSNAKQVGLTLGRRSVVFALCLFKEKKIIENRIKERNGKVTYSYHKVTDHDPKVTLW